jgi:hypothetical protein
VEYSKQEWVLDNSLAFVKDTLLFNQESSDGKILERYASSVDSNDNIIGLIPNFLLRLTADVQLISSKI